MKKTLLLPVDPMNLASLESQSSLAQAASILRNGGTVAFPTETVYGLGANALTEEAVRKIFDAKQRPDWDPLIVHVSGKAAVASLAAVSHLDSALMEAFWPGPLTLLLPKNYTVPAIVTAGRPQVGVRMPAHPVARKLIDLAGLPIAAPSANSFGRTSPTTAQHVFEDLDGRIDAILDGGPTTLGLESTVIDANAEPAMIYRPGMISIEHIRQILPDVAAFVSDSSAKQDQVLATALPAPGVGLRHYAPLARLVLVQVGDLERAVAESMKAGGLTGVMLPDDLALPTGDRLRIFRWGAWDDAENLAQRLFLGLRGLDQQGVARIVCPVPPHLGVGAALRDRLEKAAKPR